jgi:hypothetical protein
LESQSSEPDGQLDIVVILCGQYTHTATGVAHELEIACDEGKEYFLLQAYADKTCTRLTNGTTEKMYEWTWPNLKLLIGGSR